MFRDAQTMKTSVDSPRTASLWSLLPPDSRRRSDLVGWRYRVRFGVFRIFGAGQVQYFHLWRLLFRGDGPLANRNRLARR